MRQRDIFDEFTNFKGYSEETLFLRSLVVAKSSKANLDPKICMKKRENVYNYHFIDEHGSLTQVCLSFFTKVLRINRKKVFRAIFSAKTNPNAIECRGSSVKCKNAKLNQQCIKEFISKLVTYDGRRNTKYLHPRLNIRRMYQLYQEECVFKKRSIVSETIFRRIFKNDFKLVFPRRTKPNCKVCQSKARKQKKSNPDSEVSENPNTQQDEHITRVMDIKNELIQSVKHAQEQKEEVLTFELQHSLELPFLSTKNSDDVFYRKQLWLHTLCVYDEVRQIGYIYVWDESIAGRNSEEIASCLFTHFTKNIPHGTRKIKLFCSPSERNRNIEMLLMLKKFIHRRKSGDLSIEQHFFHPGHTKNSCNRMFDSISTKLQPDEIFVPVHVVKLMEKLNFTVTQMSTIDFISCQPLKRMILDPTKAQDEQTIKWNSFQRIIIEGENSLTFKTIEYGEKENIGTICLKAKCSVDDFFKTKLGYMHSNRLPITKEKYDDLQVLLKYIPLDCYEFFRSIPNIKNNDEMRDYALVQSSDEEE